MKENLMTTNPKNDRFEIGDDDDSYDRMKDAYAEGWGAPYNEKTRRELQEEIDNEKDQW
jgi:hypothetical protein